MRLNIGKMLMLAVVASVVIAGCGNREPEKSVGQLQQEGTICEYVPSEKAFKAEISEIYLPTGELQEYTAWLYTSIPETE